MHTKLRAELEPPVLDEAKVAVLSRLAEELDGARPGEADAHPVRFNAIAGIRFEARDFQGISGSIGHEEWVRQVLSEPSARPLPDVTHEELVELVRRVTSAAYPDHVMFFYLRMLELNLPDPHISDLIYWPDVYFGDDDAAGELTPEQIVNASRARAAERRA